MTNFSATLCLSLLFLATPAFAETAYIAPTAPAIPESFSSLAIAEAAEEDVETYLLASAQYQQCLVSEWDALGEERTPAQDAEITALRDTAKSQAKALAQSYNAKVIALHNNG